MEANVRANQTLLIAAGNIGSEAKLATSIAEASRIIAVDGGLSHLNQLGICPRIVIGDLDSAEEARQQANDALAQYEAELVKARTEAGEMIAKARQDAKAVAEELRANNTRELGEIKQAATADIDAAKKAAIGELHAQASTLAVAIAGKILDREISAVDQQALVNETLAEMANTK